MLSASICIRAIVIEFLEDRKFDLTSRDIQLIPTSDLCYEYSVLQSDHCPVVSGVFRWFRSVISHCDTVNGPAKVREMVDMFCHYSEEMCISLREYILTEGIVETCYRVRVEDTDLVCQVMKTMFRVSWIYTFSFLFFFEL